MSRWMTRRGSTSHRQLRLEHVAESDDLCYYLNELGISNALQCDGIQGESQTDVDGLTEA